MFLQCRMSCFKFLVSLIPRKRCLHMRVGRGRYGYTLGTKETEARKMFGYRTNIVLYEYLQGPDKKLMVNSNLSRFLIRKHLGWSNGSHDTIHLLLVSFYVNSLGKTNSNLFKSCYTVNRFCLERWKNKNKKEQCHASHTFKLSPNEKNFL